MGSVIFFGKTGSGKSSMLNALFDLHLSTNNAVSCTKAIARINVTIRGVSGKPVHLTVVDTPGFGESEDADVDYLPSWEEESRKAGQIVWLLQADTRAYRADQAMLRRLAPRFAPNANFTFVLSHADRIGPGDWDYTRNAPSRQQAENLGEKKIQLIQRFMAVNHLTNIDWFTCCSLSGYGIDALRLRLAKTR